MNMRSFSTLALGISALTLASAQNTEVTYFEGSPRHRDGGGVLSDLDYGSALRTGEAVITGSRDQVELAQGDAATIRVRPNTVFTIRELEQDGRKEQVLTASVGAVSMRFNRLAGWEPRVGTTGAVAGIRGTELTIYAGPDGSSLFVVDSGLVQVSSAGQSVELGQDEGVEVPAGGPPGQKFSVIGREVDFADWAGAKTAELLADPEAGLVRVDALMTGFRAGLDEWTAKYQAAKLASDAAVEQMNAIADKEAQKKYRDEVWFPLALQTGNAVLNYRYHALSALSLRRYVLGPLYLQMKGRYILDQNDAYRAFSAAYDRVLADYRSSFEPYLNTVDY